jgi:Protein of unknown function (DUF4058)
VDIAVMPLLDHFHPPLSARRRWHSFHHAWATVIAFDLNRRLPPGYFADPNAQYGIEIDVGAFEDEKASGVAPDPTPPAPTMTVPITLITDIVEISIFSSEAGPVLIGAIELVSPANKDRPDTRDAFVSKCASLVQQGVGLIVVDIVTDRWADLHAELLRRLNNSVSLPKSSDLWAAAYRPWQEAQKTDLQIWHHPLTLAASLPTLPFWLKGGPYIEIDLEATYTYTCREERLIPAANGPPAA